MAHRTEDSDIIFDGFEEGIAPDPYSGWNDIENVNISDMPGEVSLNYALVSNTHVSRSGTITVDAATDTVTFSDGNALPVGQAITVATSVGGLTAGKVYYAYTGTNSTNNKLLTSYAAIGSPAVVDITSNASTTYATVDMAAITHMRSTALDAAGIIITLYYAIDKQGRVWQYDETNGRGWIFTNNGATDTNSLPGNSFGNGLVIWHGYIFAIHSNRIQVASLRQTPTFANADWTQSWQTLSKVNSLFSGTHYAMVSSAFDSVFFCNDVYVGTIRWTGGVTDFNPATPSTYIFSETALIVPSFASSTCIGELSSTLYIGTTSNFILSWDGKATYATDIIPMPDLGTTFMVSANNLVYIFAGFRGRIYVTNGASVQEVAKLPDYLLPSSTHPYFIWKSGCVSRNKVLFSFLPYLNDGTAGTGLGGVWSLDMNTRAIVKENTPSTGNNADITAIMARPFRVSSLGITQNISLGSGYFAAWYNGSVGENDVKGGVDSFIKIYDDNDVLPTVFQSTYTNYEGVLISEWVNVGTFRRKKTFEEIEFKLRQPLKTGEKVKVQYRILGTDTFVDVGETIAIQDDVTISDIYPINFELAQWVQFKILLSSIPYNASNRPSFVHFKELRIRSAI